MSVEQFLVIAAFGATAVFSWLLCLFAWQRRSLGSWAISMASLAFFLGVWLFTYTLEIQASTLVQKVFWAKMAYWGIVSVPISWFCFALQYARSLQGISWRWLLLLSIVPAITLFFVWTNEQSHLIWATLELSPRGELLLLKTSYGPWFWAHAAYSYSLIMAGMVFVFQTYLRYSRPYRWQNASLIIGAVLPLLANFIFLSGLIRDPGLDYTAFAFALSILLMANAVFRHRLFDIVPIARHTAVSNMRDAMIVLDLQYRVVDVNHAATVLMEQAANDIVGRPLADLLYGSDKELLMSLWGIDDLHTEISTLVYGQNHYFDLQIAPLCDQQQRLYGRLVVLHDITIHKIAEQSLSQAHEEALNANRFKSELLARVSHELRTPLNVILGYSEMLHEGIFGHLTPEQLEPMEKILQSTKFLTRQVNELLDLSRLEAGRLDLHNREFSLQELFQRVANTLGLLAEGKQIQLVSTVEPSVPLRLFGDPDRLEQILLNLVGNGIKFTSRGAVYQRAFVREVGLLTLQVTDDGIGIPPEMHALIFEPFKQVDGSPTRLHGGAGLGLSIVRQLVELMHGRIELESQVGQGSTFTIYLPLVTP